MDEIKTNKKYIIGMIISIAAMNALYIICAIGWWKEETLSQLLDYGKLVIFYAGLGMFLVWVAHFFNRVAEKGLQTWQKGFVILLWVFLVMFGGSALDSEAFLMKLSVIGKSLWILLCCLAVWGLSGYMKRKQVHSAWLYDVAYFAAILIGMILLEDIFVPLQSTRWDTVETFYLLAAANVVYLLWRKNNRKTSAVSVIIMNLLILIMTTIRNDRLLSILNQIGLERLGIKFFPSTSTLDADWITYRLAGLSGSLERSFEQPIIMADGRERMLCDMRKYWVSCFKHPLTAVNQLYGIFAVLTFVILLTVFLLCLWKLFNGASAACFVGKAFCVCLVIKAIFAFLSELFMVWSSDVVFPMIGYGIRDLTVYICVLCLFQNNSQSDK